MNATELKSALQRWAEAMTRAAPELNALDGRLGDGDLGATLEKCAANVQAVLPAMPDTLDGIFKSAAQACAKASGSSFGTLLAVAFLGAAKWTPPRQVLSRHDVVELIEVSVQNLCARGGASLGDKTMLDALDAVRRALKHAAPDANGRAVALDALQQSIDDFRDKPNKIGRARMFADKSIGLDDPGMVAILRMAQAL